MRFFELSNAGRVLFLSVGLYLSILSAIYALFGCFEIWASLISDKWPNAAYAGIVLSGVTKICGAVVVVLIFILRMPWLTKLAGYCSVGFVPISVVWLLVSWIIWSRDKKKGWKPPGWEVTFWAFETVFVLVSLVLLFWTLQAFLSAARIQKVGGRGFEGRRWRNVVDYMKQRNRREAERLAKAEKWLAAEIALDTKQRQYQEEALAAHKQKKQEQREESQKLKADRAEEKRQLKAAKEASAERHTTPAHHSVPVQQPQHHYNDAGGMGDESF